MERYLEKNLLNAKVVEIFRVCEIVCFVFELSDKKKLNLHVSCFLRIFDSNGSLVISSTNMFNRSPNYHKKWYKRYDWSQIGATVFDDAIKEFKDKLCSTKISSFKFENKDIKIKFENEMRMDVLISVTKYDDVNYSENYRIFEKGNVDEHYEV